MKSGSHRERRVSSGRVLWGTTPETYVELGVLTQNVQRNRPEETGSNSEITVGIRRNVRITDEPEEMEGVYIISVAARILEMHPQTLRKYERVGLVRPSRTIGMLRLYSEEDIARLRLIKHLVGDLGLNLAGVQLALELFNRLLGLKTGVDTMRGGELKTFLTRSLNDIFGLLHARLP